MKMKLLTLMLLLLPLFSYGKDDYCFYTNKEGEINYSYYRSHVKQELRRLVVLITQKQIKPGTFFKSLVHDWRTNCLSLDSSEDIKQYINKIHADRRESFKKITHPKGLNKCMLVVAGDKPPYKRILIKYPEEKDFTLFDEFKIPIKINVLLVAEDVVQYHVDYKGKYYTFYRGINTRHELLHIPNFDEELTKIDAGKRKQDASWSKVTLPDGDLLYKNNDALFTIACSKAY